MKAQGFKVTVVSTGNVTKIKDQKGVPSALRSCHTAEVGGYVVEGHVPAADVRRLLRERPKVAGIAVAGMPIGSPGMEQGPAQRYEVTSFDRTGKQAVFARH